MWYAKKKLGGGNFGDVYKGLMDGEMDVAMKTIRSGELSKEFQKEVELLRLLNHPNVVRFYGVYTDDEIETFMIFEYCVEGSLDTLLQDNSATITSQDLFRMAKQAASGMEYLEANSIVHRDLALRNLLVTRTFAGKYVVKVGDFGMSRLMKEDKGYYKTNDRTIPVKWSAVEVIKFGRSSSKSDVWSFGVCLWEMWSYGVTPYPGMSNAEVMEFLDKGQRLKSPANCPTEITDMMKSCWSEVAVHRPSFRDLRMRLEELYKDPTEEESAAPGKEEGAKTSEYIIEY